jgi:hypothetical protein
MPIAAGTPRQPSVQTAVPAKAAKAAATIICAVSATVRKGKDMRARWAAPSMVPPVVAMPKAPQLAIAGSAARAAGGGLAHCPHCANRVARSQKSGRGRQAALPCIGVPRRCCIGEAAGG